MEATDSIDPGLTGGIPDLPPTMPGSRTPSGAPVRNAGFTGEGDLPVDAELVVIIRSKQNPQVRSEIYVVDQASPQLMSEIVAAARAGARPPVTPASTQQGVQPQRFAQTPQYGGPAVVRGQSAE
jgi:hypothetical protein